jgi:hypothetical protein
MEQTQDDRFGGNEVGSDMEGEPDASPPETRDDSPGEPDEGPPDEPET